MLHLVSSPEINDVLLEAVNPKDALVMLDDAVFNGLRFSKRAARLCNLTAKIDCYVIAEHLLLRGIDVSELVMGINVIDYEGLVKLTEVHPVSYAWS